MGFPSIELNYVWKTFAIFTETFQFVSSTKRWLVFIVFGFFTIFPFFCVILMRQKLYLCDKKCNGKPGSYCIFMWKNLKILRFKIHVSQGQIFC